MAYTYTVGGNGFPSIEDVAEPAEEIKDVPQDGTVVQTRQVEEPPAESIEEPIEELPVETADNPYEGYSEAAVYAAQLKDTGTFADDYEINKEINHHDLLKEMIASAEAKALENATAELYRRGWTEENLKTSQYLQQGGDPTVLNEAAFFGQLANASPESEEDKDYMLKAMYQHRGLGSEDTNELIQRAKDSGKVDDRLGEAKQLFANLAQEAAQKVKVSTPSQEEIREQLETRNSNIKTIIDKGQVGPFTVSSKDQQELYDYVTDQRYISVQTDAQGNKYNTYVSGFEKAFNDLVSNLDKQLILAKLLKDDFNFKELTQETERKTINSALDYLNRTPKETPKRKQNPYYRE